MIGIVDAVEFTELYESGMYGSFFQDQIENSDVILVNKADLAGEAAIAAVEGMIGSINPRAIQFRTINAEIPLALPEAPARREIAHSACHFHFETHSILISGTPSFAAMAALIGELARGSYGSVARAKALVQTADGPYRYDVVYGKISTTKFEKDVVSSRLVVIGERLDAEALFRDLVASSRR